MAALANLAHFSPQILDFSHLHQRPELESLSPNYPLQISTFTFSTHISRFITQHLSIYHFHKHKLKFSTKNLVKCGLYIFFYFNISNSCTSAPSEMAVSKIFSVLLFWEIHTGFLQYIPKAIKNGSKLNS